MSLMVTHTTHFYLKIDKTGNVKGEGIITYDLIPNLCGLAALTKQVNEAINMMDKIPSIFKWAGELSKKAISNFNREWHDEEAKLVKSLNEFSSFTKNYTVGELLLFMIRNNRETVHFPSRLLTAVLCDCSIRVSSNL